MYWHSCWFKLKHSISRWVFLLVANFNGEHATFLLDRRATLHFMVQSVMTPQLDPAWRLQIWCHVAPMILVGSNQLGSPPTIDPLINVSDSHFPQSFLFCRYFFPAVFKCGEKHTYAFHTEKTLSLPASIMCKILRHVALMCRFKCKVWGTRFCRRPLVV